MKELSELSVKGQFFLTKRQLGNQEGHVVEVAKNMHLSGSLIFF